MTIEAWKGDLNQALGLVETDQLGRQVEAGFLRAFGRSPAEEENPTWRASLPALLRKLDKLLPGQCGIIVEYMLPFNGQRIDMVIVGQDSEGGDVALAIELKDWTRSGASTHEHFVMFAGREYLHPSAQALNYGGKLRFFHSEARSWNVSQCAFITSGDSHSHSVLLSPEHAKQVKDAPVFFTDTVGALLDWIRGLIVNEPKRDAVTRFNQGVYSQSVELLEGLGRLQGEFLERAENVLAYNGWGLSADQQLAEDEILGRVRNLDQGEPCAFLVRGGPGSGKSLLAHRVFFGSMHFDRKTILCVRNNRLMASLRKILDPHYLGLRGVLKFNSTRGRNGVEDGNTRIADVVVCDEGQRLSLKTPNVFRRAPLTVILYDSGQVLNLGERGTEAELERVCREAGIEPIHLELPTPHRCRGGEAYLRWVDVLLASPGRAFEDDRGWSRAYELGVADSADDLRSRLVRFRDVGESVGLLASFTRGSGRDRPKDAKDLKKVRVPEASPPIEWLMDPEREYVPFWVGRESNQLEKCASIYGCQGFELDHAGLIWGEDLVIRNGRWELGDPDVCYDTAPGSPPLAQVMRSQPATAIELLRNRYRIFLTRGILGTYVTFEDDETKRFFSDLLSKGRI